MRRKEDMSTSPVSGESTSIWIMVGTSRVSVTWCSAIAVATPTGVNIGTMTWVDPLSIATDQAARSARWNIGAQCRKRPSLVMTSVELIAPIAAMSRLSWLSCTPLGRAVVPPV